MDSSDAQNDICVNETGYCLGNECEPCKGLNNPPAHRELDVVCSKENEHFHVMSTKDLRRPCNVLDQGIEHTAVEHSLVDRAQPSNTKDAVFCNPGHDQSSKDDNSADHNTESRNPCSLPQSTVKHLKWTR